MTLADIQAAAGLRTPIRHQLFIGGRFVDAESGETQASLNPHDNSAIVDVAMAGKADIDKAVAAATKTHPAWARMAAADRGRILLKLADLIEANTEELARLESLDTGHPLKDSRALDVPRTAACFRYFGGMADKLQGDVVPVESGFLNYLLREPVGQVVPWNFPLMFTSWKMAPALAAGNTVVMKPAEITPLTSLKIAELMAEAGMPEGVVNMVPGLGAVAGQTIAEHDGIAKVAFTGSTAAGRRIVQASAGNLKKVQLELGGKGPNIVFDDANLVAAVNGSAWAIFHNQGQACIAGSRLMLHERIADAFLDKFIPLAKSIRLGNPLDPATEMGPLTSAQHGGLSGRQHPVGQDLGADGAVQLPLRHAGRHLAAVRRPRRQLHPLHRHQVQAGVQCADERFGRAGRTSRNRLPLRQKLGRLLQHRGLEGQVGPGGGREHRADDHHRLPPDHLRLRCLVPLLSWVARSRCAVHGKLRSPQDAAS